MKTIQLKPNGVGRYDDVSPFIITDNKLKLKIELPNFNGEFYLITENNDNSATRLLPRNGVIELEDLAAGELFIRVKHYIKGELIKTYNVEPLLLREVDGSITAEPEIAVLMRENAQLASLLAEERERAQTRENGLNKAICALVRFAYADYRDNVYLGGGDAEQFLTDFGFELSEEQKKEIFGGSNND